MCCGHIGKNNIKQNNNFGIEMALRGYWTEACFRWKKILQYEPLNAYIHNNLAVAYENNHKLELALREFQIAIMLEPENKTIKKNYEEFIIHISTKE
jgi:Tfp pilus assembly protein PilF